MTPDTARTRRRRSALLLLVPVAAFMGLFFGWPLLKTLVAAFADLSVWTWFETPYLRGRLWIATQQALLSVLLTFVLAVPLAWYHHKHDIPWNRALLAIHAAPFVLPVFVVVFGIQNLLGPQGWLAALTGFDMLGTVGPLGAVVIAHAYYNYGFAARILHTVLDRRPHRLEAAAATLGASPRATFFRVTLPLLAPSMLAVALLVFLFTFTSFGVVLFMGGGTVSTLETMIYQNLGGAFPRYDRAALLGVVQLALNTVVLYGYMTLRKREAGLERDPRILRRPTLFPHRAAAWAFLGLGLLPALALLSGGFRVDGRWTLEAWRALLDKDHPAHVTGFDLFHATGLSLLYAVATVALALTLTLMLAYGVRQLRRWPRRAAEVLTALPLGTSSILIGLGYLLAFGAFSSIDLRGTIVVIIIAHTLIAFPFAARVMLPAIDMHERRLDEAAALLGAPPMDVVRRVHLPLLMGPLLVAVGLAAAMSLGDFGASLLLMRTDTMSIAVWIERHDLPFRDIMRAQATALSAVLMLLAAGAYLVAEAFRPRAPGVRRGETA